MTEHDDKTFKIVYSNQQRMKVYSLVRTTLTDSDFDDSEDSYVRSTDAYFANGHNQEDRLPDSFNSNACFSDDLPLASD